MKRWPWVRIVVSLVLGVLLTLASAWGPGLWKLRPSWLFAVPAQPVCSVSVTRARAPGWTTETNRTFWTTNIMIRNLDTVAGPPSVQELHTLQVVSPGWAPVEQLDVTGHTFGVYANATGLPIRNARYWTMHSWSNPGASSEHYLWRISAQDRSGFRHTVLPLDFLVGPTLLNSLFWFSFSLGLMSILTAARSWLRRRRGRCVACGYSLAGVAGPCPECGRVPKSARRAPLSEPAAEPQ